MTRGVLRIIFIAPSVILFSIFGLLPMLGAVLLSLTNWNGLNAPKFVGVTNWVTFAHDPQAWHSLVLTLEVMGLTWVIQTPLSVAIGMFLAGRSKYREILSIFYFLPLLFSSVAIAIVWSYILDPNFGLLNELLTKVGLGRLALDWLGSPSVVLWTVVAIVSWQYIPFHSLLYQSGRRQIPNSLYEAAIIDGANELQRFVYITVPQLKYTFITSTTLMLTGSLTFFDLIYILTNGGPDNASNVLAVNMYDTAFSKQQMGYGSVMAVVIALMGIVLSLMLTRFTGFTRMESQQQGVA
ncbi:carbohydrate ABC transporter permease [Alicyclobacillus sendaiensis]|uniref:carbohydrate ABC transporter permease n=1 Tax=Alicyclobacillus sendaiensis TaxID=192387 RepID=UPI000781440E|nr:sugar ABC transporter permease [Alicyclobacillus sendaiensis]